MEPISQLNMLRIPVVVPSISDPLPCADGQRMSGCAIKGGLCGLSFPREDSSVHKSNRAWIA